MDIGDYNGPDVPCKQLCHLVSRDKDKTLGITGCSSSEVRGWGRFSGLVASGEVDDISTYVGGAAAASMGRQQRKTAQTAA
jgi:hypothetical protein